MYLRGRERGAGFWAKSLCPTLPLRAGRVGDTETVFPRMGKSRG